MTVMIVIEDSDYEYTDIHAQENMVSFFALRQNRDSE